MMPVMGSRCAIVNWAFLLLFWFFLPRTKVTSVAYDGQALPNLSSLSTTSQGCSTRVGFAEGTEERGAGAGGRGDPRADFEPAILPFQGMRRQAVAADHFHALPGVSVFQTYACLAPDQAPRQWWQ